MMAYDLVSLQGIELLIHVCVWSKIIKPFLYYNVLISVKSFYLINYHSATVKTSSEVTGIPDLGNSNFLSQITERRSSDLLFVYKHQQPFQEGEHYGWYCTPLECLCRNMGIYKLGEFVKSAGSQFYVRQNICGKRIIIDANNFLHSFCSLCPSNQTAAVRGGDYSSFATLVTDFCCGLSHADITPYFIFDGASKINRFKFRKKKANDKLAEVTRMVSTKQSKGHFRYCLDLQVRKQCDIRTMPPNHTDASMGCAQGP